MLSVVLEAKEKTCLFNVRLTFCCVFNNLQCMYILKYVVDLGEVGLRRHPKNNYYLCENIERV